MYRQQEAVKAAALGSVVRWVRKRWPDQSRFYLADGFPVTTDATPSRNRINLSAIPVEAGVSLEQFDGSRPLSGSYVLAGVSAVSVVKENEFRVQVWVFVPPPGGDEDNGAGDVTVISRGETFAAAPYSGPTMTANQFLLSAVATERLRSDLLKGCRNWLWEGDSLFAAAESFSAVTIHRGRLSGGKFTQVRSSPLPAEGEVDGWFTRFSPKGTYVSWMEKRKSKMTRLVAPVEDLRRARRVESESEDTECLWVNDAELVVVRYFQPFGIERFEASSGHRVSSLSLDQKAFGSRMLYFPRFINDCGEIVFNSNSGLVAVSLKDGRSRQIPLEMCEDTADVMLNGLNGGREIFCRDGPQSSPLDPFKRFRFWRANAEGRRLGKVIQPAVLPMGQSGSTDALRNHPYTAFGSSLSQPAFVLGSSLWELK